MVTPRFRVLRSRFFLTCSSALLVAGLLIVAVLVRGPNSLQHHVLAIPEASQVTPETIEPTPQGSSSPHASESPRAGLLSPSQASSSPTKASAFIPCIEIGGDSSLAGGGRYVAFSAPPRCDTKDTESNYIQAYVHDHLTGAITLVSRSATGSPGNGQSAEVAMSADGRYVAFESSATNLVPGDSNGKGDVFVRDLVKHTIVRVSVSSEGVQANGPSYGPVLSADGHLVAFGSAASNLVPGDTNGASDVFLHDLASDQTSLVSVATSGNVGNRDSGGPSISDNGNLVAFDSNASDLVPADSNGAEDVFVRNMAAAKTARVSMYDGMELHAPSRISDISPDGGFVGFGSGSGAPVGKQDTANGLLAYAYVVDLSTGSVRALTSKFPQYVGFSPEFSDIAVALNDKVVVVSWWGVNIPDVYVYPGDSTPIGIGIADTISVSNDGDLTSGRNTESCCRGDVGLWVEQWAPPYGYWPVTTW
jgi:archaellum component FlaF (FlaF/FlaG flagellin family)